MKPSSMRLLTVISVSCLLSAPADAGGFGGRGFGGGYRPPVQQYRSAPRYVAPQPRFNAPSYYGRPSYGYQQRYFGGGSYGSFRPGYGYQGRSYFPGRGYPYRGYRGYGGYGGFFGFGYGYGNGEDRRLAAADEAPQDQSVRQLIDEPQPQPQAAYVPPKPIYAPPQIVSVDSYRPPRRRSAVQVLGGNARPPARLNSGSAHVIEL